MSSIISSKMKSMLERTFIHIQGIGPKTEQKLWDRGFLTWHDFLQTPQTVFSRARDHYIRGQLEKSLENLENPAWWSGRLPAGQMWRVFETFKDSVAYLDIETCGWDRDVSFITMIGIYDGKSSRTFIDGFNLADFEIAVADYKLVVTFNGAGFDLPVIRQSFPHIHLPPAHIDLRFVLNKLGLRGGLKRIEKELGITRGPDIDGMSGLDAETLWRAWERGDKNALDTLVAYNTADIENLEPLLEWACRQLTPP